VAVPAKVYTCAVVGLDGQLVEVEVDIAPGLPAFNIVGLPDTAVQEARERVRAAVRDSEFVFPMRRITGSLAPLGAEDEDPSIPWARFSVHGPAWRDESQDGIQRPQVVVR
jgi:magnesium chelatase family protein